MSGEIDMGAADLQLVREILTRQLPPRSRVWVFGSRAKGGARRASDLDLAIDAGRPLTAAQAAILAEALDESDLPCRVDIVDWRTLSPDFARLIDADRVPLELDAPGAPADGSSEHSPQAGFPGN